ncbi:hypothetical protein K501DRAFT_280445 [Backusella circina FSU 941]|nr:hypothetical protein K501DRAFT_280445 [Backusella circina FSU 941]
MVANQAKFTNYTNDTSNTSVRGNSDAVTGEDEVEVDSESSSVVEQIELETSSIEENSIADQYLLQIQNRLKGPNGQRARQQPDQYRNEIFWGSSKTPPLMLDENPKNPSQLYTPRAFYCFPTTFINVEDKGLDGILGSNQDTQTVEIVEDVFYDDEDECEEGAGSSTFYRFNLPNIVEDKDLATSIIHALIAVTVMLLRINRYLDL